MTDTYMQKYIGRNIYKVSNPPGGQSSIRLGWDQPTTINQVVHQDKLRMNNNVNRKSYVNNNHKNYGNNSMMMENINNSSNSLKQYNQGIRIRNEKQVNNVGNNSFGNVLSSSQMISSKPTYSNTPISYTKSIINSTTPFQYTSLNTKSRPYIQQQLINSNLLIQPLNTNSSNDSLLHLQKWQQSTRQLEEELRYYQQKNRVLKEKLYGANQDFKYVGDYGYQQPKRKRVSSLGDMAEELELALQQRYQYRHSNNSP